MKTFDDAVPGLQMMRNIGKHIDDYALETDKRRHKRVNRRALEVGAWDGTTYKWLDIKLNIDDAHKAAADLYSAVSKHASNQDH